MLKKILILISFIFLSAAGSAAVAAPELTDVIYLDSGPIRGKYEDGMRVFLGIPYAAPPVGKLRWTPPKPVEPWKKTNFRFCTDFGPSCPQPGSTDGNKFSEDCLYLNIWAKNKPAAKLPVMVWIHGGSFNTGSASQPEFNGLNLAGEGVIVVTINYRLGPLGFLAHPLLSKESSQDTSGNYGLLDQIAALKWVQKNIAAFGGDPEAVTIFGQDAGAASVALLIISPLSEGLFQRAIVQSGSPLIGTEFINPSFNGSMANALKMGEELASKLGGNNAGNVIKEMRAKSVQEIVNAAGFRSGLFKNGLFFAPVFDGWVLPANPITAYKSGKIADVPLIIGSTANEGMSYLTGENNLSVEKYKVFLKDRFSGRAEKAWELFSVANAEDVDRGIDNVITTGAYACPARFVAECMAQRKSRSYLYQFTRRPETDNDDKLEAYHGSELDYIFGNIDESEGYNDWDIELSEKMMAYWVNFAKTGNPNGRGLFYWPGYKGKSDINLELGDTIQSNKNLFQKECDFIHWETY